MATKLNVLSGFLVVLGILVFFAGVLIPISLNTGEYTIVGLILVFGGLWLNKAYAKPKKEELKSRE